jgi:hypothetical protein
MDNLTQLRTERIEKDTSMSNIFVAALKILSKHLRVNGSPRVVGGSLGGHRSRRTGVLRTVLFWRRMFDHFICMGSRSKGAGRWEVGEGGFQCFLVALPLSSDKRSRVKSHTHTHIWLSEVWNRVRGSGSIQELSEVRLGRCKLIIISNPKPCHVDTINHQS